MPEPRWLSLNVVLAVHSESVATFGGSPGARDIELRESTLARPRNLFVYKQATIFELAASYCFGLTKDHTFIDGNKRIGFLAAGVFLRLNGFSFNPNEADIVRIITAVAAGEADESMLAGWFNDFSTAIYL